MANMCACYSNGSCTACIRAWMRLIRAKRLHFNRQIKYFGKTLFLGTSLTGANIYRVNAILLHDSFCGGAVVRAVHGSSVPDVSVFVPATRSDHCLPHSMASHTGVHRLDRYFSPEIPSQLQPSPTRHMCGAKRQCEGLPELPATNVTDNCQNGNTF
jgi:hypothetical protein